MELRNYLFIDGEKKITAEIVGSRAVGSVFGREGFEDGANIATSVITECNGDIVKTKSGSEYTLVDINPDYAEFLEQKKVGIPIITDWRLQRDTLTKYIPTLPEEDMLLTFEEAQAEIQKVTANCYDGLMLIGYVDGKLVGGEIVAQRGNFITLSVPDPDDPFKMIDKKFLVIWRNMDKEVEAEITFTSEYEDYDYDKDFEYAYGFRCRPNFSEYIAWREEFYSKE